MDSKPFQASPDYRSPSGSKSLSIEPSKPADNPEATSLPTLDELLSQHGRTQQTKSVAKVKNKIRLNSDCARNEVNPALHNHADLALKALVQRNELLRAKYPVLPDYVYERSSVLYPSNNGKLRFDSKAAKNTLKVEVPENVKEAEHDAVLEQEALGREFTKQLERLLEIEATIPKEDRVRRYNQQGLI